MRAAGLVAALLLATATTCLAARDLQAAAQTAIVNGVNAVKGRHRYMASLRTNGAHFCGGSLIHPQVVLTAAHCAVIEESPLVRLGGYQLTKDAASQYVERTTAQRVVHPGFADTFGPARQPVTNYLNNDVALYKLSAPVTTLPTLRLVGRKPKPSNPVPDGTQVLIVGWGAVDSERKNLAETLQMLPEKVLPLATCQAAWGTSLDWNGDGVTDPENFLSTSNTMMCAARADYPNNLAGFCAGDSGGPLIANGTSAAADVQVGIVSWGADKCGAAAESPYVYTDIGQVFDWINSTVRQMTGQYLQYTSPASPTSPPAATRPVISGFNGQQIAFPGAANAGQYVLQYPGRWYLYGRLGTGPTTGSLVVNQYQWRWGTTVVASVNSASRALTVTVGGTTLAAGKTAAARNGTVRYAAQAVNRARSLTIAETGVTVTLTQPWLVAEATWARWLNVAVTITQRPAVKLTGLMGGTLDITAGGAGTAAFAAKTGSVNYTPLVRRRSLLEGAA